MLVTLIPLFDENLNVSAYSLFSQRYNFLLHPNFSGTAKNDGATYIEGLEVIEAMGWKTTSPSREFFISIGNVSIFSDIPSQCSEPHSHLVLMIDDTISPTKMYLDRLKELKKLGYRLAVRNLSIHNYNAFSPILKLMNYILIDSQKVNINKARVYFNKHYPGLKLVASNIKDIDTFKKLANNNNCFLFEGSFFRRPVTHGSNELAPLKINYIQLMNLVNKEHFDWDRISNIIRRDTEFLLLVLEMIHTMTAYSDVTSIQQAASVMGEEEFKRWINTAVIKELSSDMPNEVVRISLFRAEFAEMMAPYFGLGQKSSELYLAGLLSVLDIMLDKPMERALKMVKVSKDIRCALLNHTGTFADALSFVMHYEAGDWQEVSRLMILHHIEMDAVQKAYADTLRWYQDLTPISNEVFIPSQKQIS